MNSPHIVVIGGGAAGFFAAITCADRHPQAHVTLLEKSKQFLSKVRISGGGRCNVTCACFEPDLLTQSYPRGGKALRGPFTRFQPRDTIEWFATHGVQLKTEPDGRMFPVSDSSATIVECLVHAALNAGVELRTEAGITSVERGFTIRMKSGEQIVCDEVLLATGSNRQGFEWAASLGHTIEPPVPSLFTFTISDPRLSDLAGVSVPNVRLELARTRLIQSGPVLITHWGLSGPAVLKLSAWGARVLHDRQYQAELIVNWLPDITPDDLGQQIQVIKSEQARRSVESHSPFQLPQRLWKRLVAEAGITREQRWADVSKMQIERLVEELTQGRYTIQGKGIFKEEFVTCGGVDLDEVNFRTMESRRCPGLYFAGEILDIDGLTGGFNFQSAWTTGWIAGQSMGGR